MTTTTQPSTDLYDVIARRRDVRAELLRGSSSQMVRGPSFMDRARHAIAA